MKLFRGAQDLYVTENGDIAKWIYNYLAEFDPKNIFTEIKT